jgi:hypothetical protein
MLFSTSTREIADVLVQHKIELPIMYDPNHRVGSAYGVHNVPGGMDMGPVNTHSVFVIDKEGKVRWHEISAHDYRIGAVRFKVPGHAFTNYYYLTNVRFIRTVIFV